MADSGEDLVCVFLIVGECTSEEDLKVFIFSNKGPEKHIPASQFKVYESQNISQWNARLLRKSRPRLENGRFVTTCLYSIPPEKFDSGFNYHTLPPGSPIPQSLKDILLPTEVSNVISEITKDHESGARQLALKALRALQITLTCYTSSQWREIVNCAWYISKARPSMGAAIQTAIIRVLWDLQSSDPTEWNHILERHIKEEGVVLEKLAKAFTEYFTNLKIKRRVEILTLSNSSTMVAALRTLFRSPQCPNVNLTILESRPLFEGVTLAQTLLPHKNPNVSMELATDASAAYFASKADYILLGADQIDPKTGSVKNKIGSLAAAKFRHGKAICVTSTDKIEPRDDADVEENDPKEVTEKWPLKVKDVRVRNVYFEWVEGELIDLYITEEGVLSHKELSEIAGEREELFKVWVVLD